MTEATGQERVRGVPPITIHEECLGTALDRSAERWGGRTGWVFEDERYSFARMREETDRIARALMAAGIGPGDVISVWASNLPVFAALEFACAKTGAILAAVSTRSKSFELSHLLEQSEARLLIMMEGFLKHDFVETLGEVGLNPDGGRVSSDRVPHLRTVVSLASRPAPGFMAWSDFLDRHAEVTPDELARRQAERQWREPVLLQYTSGTTAAPKGALLNHRYALNVGQSLFFSMGVEPGEPILNTQPFYHIGGSCGALPTPLVMGCPVVIPEYYEAERVLQLIERERCVARTGFAAMYIMEMNHPNFAQYDIGSIRAGWCSGTREIIRKVRDVMRIPSLMITYSSTEVGGTTSLCTDSFDQRSTTSGRPIVGTELRIADPATGADMPDGEPGEILMRGWWQMNGYHRNPEQTAKTVDADGWVHTGDRGVIVMDGCLRFLGRYKDMLKVGGENVSAEEIEGILLSHEKIRQAAVIGAPDPRLEEVPMALIELHPGQIMDAQEVTEFVARQTANFRVPRHVRFVADWPLTGSGKIQKHKLREVYLPPLQEPAEG